MATHSDQSLELDQQRSPAAGEFVASVSLLSLSYSTFDKIVDNSVSNLHARCNSNFWISIVANVPDQSPLQSKGASRGLFPHGDQNEPFLLSH